MSGETTWTPEQRLAIEFRGNSMLVSAAAGAGKTSVLVERVIQQVLAPDQPCDIERLLVVTFTEKAALEMKERLRTALQDARAKRPEDTRIPRQISLLERAQISTIHSFCLSIVRRYFYRVNLDPGFRVLDSNESELLRYEALDEVFEERYRRDFPEYKVFQGLVEMYGGRGVDETLKQTVLRLHDFSKTQPSIETWLENTVGWYATVRDFMDSSSEDDTDGTGLDDMVLRLPWARVLLDCLVTDLDEAISYAEEACAVCLMPSGPEYYLPVIEEELAFFKEAHDLVQRISVALENPEMFSEIHVPGQNSCAVLPKIRVIGQFKFRRLPSKRKSEATPELVDRAKDFRDKFKNVFKGISKNTLMRPSGQILGELRDLVPFIECLINIVLDLDKKYIEKKKDRGGVDFSDLERYCLDILRQDDFNLAHEVRSSYDYVFVDEYQDTNPVQDAILSLVSMPCNLFMVGDIKQSIYRFRLAEPRIFLEKYNTYRHIEENRAVDSNVSGVKISLAKNFRSRKEVVDAVNYLFERIMLKDVAEIDYTEDHRLYLGASYPEESGQSLTAGLLLVERDSLSAEELPAQKRGSQAQGQDTGGDEDGGSNGVDGSDTPAQDADIEEYEGLEKEALVVASKIQELVDPEKPFKVWDARRSQFRKCTYKDIAILMRATKNRANVLIDIFQRCGIPAYSELGTGYFRAREVEVALSLLSVIDNPRQDIPLAAVLRSPVVGLTPRSLAIIKAISPKKEFYDSLVDFVALGDVPVQALGGDNPEQEVQRHEVTGLQKALSEFLEKLDLWRTMSRRMPLAHVLWTVLGETGYYDYVGGLPGGAQRQANLRALVSRAMEFDSFGRHGLFRFLRFIEKIQESKGDLGTARALGEHEDVVQVLSIHKSKGLEFPVVFVVDLGKQFNMEDLKNDILFHKDLGIGAMYCDLATRVKYPTLAYKANQAQIRNDNLAEEMRVLYVAMTRAREKLYLVGSCRGLTKQIDRWKRPGLSRAVTYLDWVCPAILHEQCAPFHVEMWGVPGAPPVPEPFSRSSLECSVTWDEVKNLVVPGSPEDPVVYPEVRKRLEWDYPYRPYTITPAKMSVGELKRRLDFEDEIWRFLPSPEKRLAFTGGRASGVERGTAIHELLARMDLAKGASELGIIQEVDRLSSMGFLDKKYIEPEDIDRICRFFASPTGELIVLSPERVRREIPFTMKLDVRLNRRGVKGSLDSGYHLDNEVVRPDEVVLNLAGGHVSGGTPKESLLVQGVIDVIIEDADGLTILDYKTDSIGIPEVPQLVSRYMPQVSLYSYGAEKILGIPVKRSVIVFLTPGVEEEIDWRGYMSRISVTSTPLSSVMWR
ncbi:MAG: UvrD-helicase domain-containing protein [Bacillota bacterium]